MSGGDDWQVGDLALCVDDAACPYFPGSKGGIQAGGVYEVRKVKKVKDVIGRLELGLQLDRCNPIHLVSGSVGYHNAIRFRKIKPLSPEEHRSAIIELANDRRVPAEATDQSWALDADFLRDERVEWRAGL